MQSTCPTSKTYASKTRLNPGCIVQVVMHLRQMHTTNMSVLVQAAIGSAGIIAAPNILTGMLVAPSYL